MREAVYDKDLQVEIRNVPRPSPGPGQVLVRTMVSGTDPKDWKYPKYWAAPGTPASNHGDDVAGYVEDVGEGVIGFYTGDRVAAFHEIGAPNGSFAEHCIARAQSTFQLPERTSIEEAATIPLAAMTAALGLFQKLGLPLPWKPATTPAPLVVYGGASSVGAYAIKLATLSNIHPIVSAAGNGIPYVESLLDKSKGTPLSIIGRGSVGNLGKVLAEGGQIATVLTPEMANAAREDAGKADVLFTLVGTVHADAPPGAKFGDREFGAVLYP